MRIKFSTLAFKFPMKTNKSTHLFLAPYFFGFFLLQCPPLTRQRKHRTHWLSTSSLAGQRDQRSEQGASWMPPALLPGSAWVPWYRSERTQHTATWGWQSASATGTPQAERKSVQRSRSTGCAVKYLSETGHRGKRSRKRD